MPPFDNFEFSFRSRHSAWESLKSNPEKIHNVVVVGGGIVGAGILRELALHKVPDCFLFEKGDFAEGTSSASSKLIHAGIRYLEQAWNQLKKGKFERSLHYFNFVFDASRERKVLGRMAPHLIKPQAIHLVLGKNDTRSPWSVVAGVWLYYVIQILQGQFFSPPSITLTRRAIKRGFPNLNAGEVKAIFRFWDSQTDDARLVIANLQDASRRGASALNYTEVTSFERTGNIFRVEVKDQESGETLILKTKVLINATGAFVDEFRRKEKAGVVRPNVLDRVAGCHINVAPPLSPESFYITADDERLVFVLARNDDGLAYSRIGTTERPLADQESSAHPKASRKEVEYLKNLVREYFPQAIFNPDTVVSVDAGIRPLRAQDVSAAFEKSREHDIIEDGGIFHMVGVKLTDFRRVAHELMEKLSIAKPSLEISQTPFPANSQTYESNVDDSIFQTMALHWSDLVYRRRGNKLLWQQRHEREIFNQTFEKMAQVLGWGEGQKKAEYAQVSDSASFSFDS